MLISLGSITSISTPLKKSIVIIIIILTLECYYIMNIIFFSEYASPGKSMKLKRLYK